MARYFNTTTDKLLTSTVGVQPGSVGTFSIWIKPVGWSPGDGVDRKFLRYFNAATQTLSFEIFANTVYIGWVIPEIRLAVSSSGLFVDGVWAHHCFRWNLASSVNHEYFVNGVSKQTATHLGTPPLDFNEFRIGTWAALNISTSMCQFARWNSFLSNAQVSALAGGDAPLLVDLSHLVEYLRIDGTANPELDEIGTTSMAVTGTTQVTGPTINYGAGATATTLTGPASGPVNAASANFTVGVDATPISGTVVVTPSATPSGGTFSPTSVSLTTASPSATFTYTAVTSGSRTISISDNGGLTDAAPVTYVVKPAVTVLLVASPTDATPQTGLSSLHWRWFDNPDVNSATPPTDRGSAGTTDGSGIFSVPLPNSTLSNLQTGLLEITNAAGTTVGLARVAVT